MKRQLFTMMLAAACTTGMAFADDEVKPLNVGDPAPEIEISHWLMGDEVTEFEEGKVYVVEFWATWCGPCRYSMPHMSELAEEYAERGVTMIGISDEPLQTVVGFLTEDQSEERTWFSTIHYALTTDPDRSVYTDYMKAAGQNGIPTAFIVGATGNVEWIGHPMSMEEPLEAIVDGSWDSEEHAKKMAKAAELEQKTEKMFVKLQEAQVAEDWATAMQIIDEIIALGEPYDSYMKTAKFELLIGGANDPAKGYAFGRKLAEEGWDDPQTLNALAWFVVDEESVQTRDLDFAMKIAKRACELTDFEDAAILDTYARGFYEKGDLVNAVKWQTKAVEFAEGSLADELKDTLENYLLSDGEL